MRTKSIVLVIGAIAVGVLCWPVTHAADTELFKTRVSVKVSANGSIKTEFESYVKRELRGLKDVELVEDSADHTLAFVILETQSRGGASIGYAISLVEAHPLSQRVFQLMFKQKLSPEDLTWIAKATESAVFIDEHKLLTCGPAELKSVCGKLVAEFDTNTLEPGRKMIRQVQGEKGEKKTEQPQFNAQPTSKAPK